MSEASDLLRSSALVSAQTRESTFLLPSEETSSPPDRIKVFAEQVHEVLVASVQQLEIPAGRYGLLLHEAAAVV